MPQSIQIHQFDNGLVLLGEHMDWLESAAFTLLLLATFVRTFYAIKAGEEVV